MTAINLPDVAYDVKLAPGARLCEGAVDLFLIRSSVTRFQILQTFLQASDGAHRKFPWTEFYKAKRVIVEPDVDEGWTSLSGELIPSSKLDITVHKGAVNFICKPTNK